MWEWYRLGIALGVGVGIGVLVAGVVAPTRAGIVGAAVISAAVGAALGFLIQDWDEAVCGAVGGAAGAVGAGLLVRGALSRGGTRGGTALLMAAAGLVIAALAFVPLLGYLAVVGVPALGGRLRRSASGRYAGLRILARD
jgi:hypothetical protein